MGGSLTSNIIKLMAEVMDLKGLTMLKHLLKIVIGDNHA